MKNRFEVTVDEDGTITMIYQPGVEQHAKDLGGRVVKSERISHVEWEHQHGGWTVRSAHDPEIAIRHCGCHLCKDDGVVRYIVGKEDQGPIAVFAERQQALEEEEKAVWKLLK